MKALFDTNILIDFLLGKIPAKKEISQFTEPSISIITWMEVLVGAKTDDEEKFLRNFLNEFKLLNTTPEVANKAVQLRKEHRIKLPDAIIWATALENNRLFVTRNTKDFPQNNPSIRVPYQI
ncbi:MAG: type II toxin-antitoxin system VapC family toxin [bacterium]|nr:type II toxin-antitoxin system VapC family toxin [bacterium]MBU1917878.1 type II toxin-antitoxin system VapC family toxin [bacterium]